MNAKQLARNFQKLSEAYSFFRLVPAVVSIISICLSVFYPTYQNVWWMIAHYSIPCLVLLISSVIIWWYTDRAKECKKEITEVSDDPDKYKLMKKIYRSEYIAFIVICTMYMALAFTGIFMPILSSK